MTEDTSSLAAAKPGLGLAGRYLTFILDEESYAIPVLRVREIIRLTTIRVLPGMPRHVRGVLNLRGKIIPVVDLRLRFGFRGGESGERTCIVVVQVKVAGGRMVPMGLVVDGVEEVVQIGATDLEPTPEFGGGVTTDCLLGMAKVKGLVKALLDIDRAVGGETLDRLEGVAMRMERPGE